MRNAKHIVQSSRTGHGEGVRHIIMLGVGTSAIVIRVVLLVGIKFDSLLMHIYLGTQHQDPFCNFALSESTNLPIYTNRTLQ